MTKSAFSARAAVDFIHRQAAERPEHIYGVRMGERVPCPLHGSDVPAFELHEGGRWSCYTRHAHGDVIDFWAQRHHGLDHGDRLSGALFAQCVREILEALGASPEDFPAIGPAEGSRKSKPYPPADEVEVLLAEAVLPLYALAPTEDGATARLNLNGRPRPGIGSFAQLHGLDMDGPGLLRILRATNDTEHRPEWAQKWTRPGVVIPTYNAHGELVSVRYRTIGESKAWGKGVHPGKKGQFAAGQLLLNRPARELLRGGDAGARESARACGVVLTEGDPSFLAWSCRHAGPVLGAPGIAIPAQALARLPRDAPILLDFDPDEAGAKYRDKALAHLTQHLDVRWSRRMRWFFETEPAARADLEAERRPKTKAERNEVAKLVGKRLESARAEILRAQTEESVALHDPDETGALGIDPWAFEPIPAAVREHAKPRVDERPKIVISTEEMEINGQAIEALKADRSIYQRGSVLVRVVNASDSQRPTDSVCDPEAPVIGVLPRPILQERLAASARWVALKEKEGELVETPAHPPGWCVDAVLARGSWPGVQHLAGIIEQPVLRPDGSILDVPGFDERTGLLYLDGGTKFLAVPARPSDAEIAGALELLADLVRDFPFASDAHKSAWLASVLTPLARYAFRGPAPLFLFDAPKAGTGKGKAMDTSIRIATGRPAPLEAYTADDNEMKKALVSWSASGRSIVAFDNVEGTFGGPSLCLAITGNTVSGRVLGLSQHYVGPLLPTWYATGNNVRPTQDMLRRICRVRLVAKVEDPSARTGFKHNLPEDAQRYRPELVRAALTILRAYIAAGRPKQEIKAWGSFEGWSALVRSAIVWAGWPDMDTRDELRESVDSKTDLERALVLGWLELVTHAKGPVTARKAIDIACNDDRDERGLVIGPGPLPYLRSTIEALASDRGKVQSRLLGYVLRKLRDQVFDTAERGLIMLHSAGSDRDGVQRWTVKAVDEAAGDARGGCGVSQSIPRTDPPQANTTVSLDFSGSAGDAGDDSNSTRAQAHNAGARAMRACAREAGGYPASPASPAPQGSDFDDDDPAPDPIALEMHHLAGRWTEGIGPRPGWPRNAKDRWRALFREQRSAGVETNAAGRYARETVDAELGLH